MGGCGVAVDVMMEVRYLRYSVAISLNNAAQATEHRTYRDVTQDLQSGLDRFPGSSDFLLLMPHAIAEFP
jgi:hypothetical protein